MPFDHSGRNRVAVIGSGVSGLAAAYELGEQYEVTLFEAAGRLGGHARTVMAGRNGDVAVDTGFIVFNYHNYPHMTRMFSELDVPVAESNMGFAASIGNGAIEYGLQNFSSITAQSRNIVRPQYWRMISDILRFNRMAVETAEDCDLSLGEFLDQLEMGEWFRRFYLLPISGAIWSSTPEQMAAFPARSLVQFFSNHALLQSKGHQWHTVDGGSIEYVRRIEAAIRAKGGDIRLNAPVAGVRRSEGCSWVRTRAGDWEAFDHVVMACHSDQALAMLEQPTADEKRILGAIRFQPNSAILHCDAREMPRRRRAWASWVFRSEDFSPAPRIGMTYWMNSLQNIDHSEPLFLSLNARERIPDEMIYDVAEFRHPVFDAAAIDAQEKLHSIQGQNQTWYAGAYTRWGFHEDGYSSGLRAARGIEDAVGVTRQWAAE